MTTPKRHRVLVLGAGIIGLSSALRIQESCTNVDVTVMADKFSPDTCSDGAAGFWEVFAVANTDQKLVNMWAAETYNYMMDLAMSPLARISAIQRVSGYQMWETKLEEELPLKDIVDGYRRMTDKEMARYPGPVKDGRSFTSLTMDVTDHLKWLTDIIKAKGACFIQRKLQTLGEFHELCNDWDVVVNCTSLGSYQLLKDDKLFPIRGQVYRVKAPWAKHFCVIDTFDGEIVKLSYVLPNFDTVVVGGVFQQRNWNEQVDKTDSKEIWERAVKMMPSLKGATILKEWVGLRPARDSIRLEPERLEIGTEKKPLRIVHNYGHGGAGITVHWGCARRSAEMVNDFIRDIQATTVTTTSLKDNNKPKPSCTRSKL